MSDDYTPTTDEVREAYATRMAPVWDDTRRRAFDDWLAAHDAEIERRGAVKALDDLLDSYFRGDKNRFNLPASTVDWVRDHPTYRKHYRADELEEGR